jgi:hypothetical protein
MTSERILWQLESHGLLANPFALLGVSTRDDREAIAHALSVRLGDPDADESFLHSAQQRLMAPRPRLEAETCWLPGLAPSRTQAVLTALRQDDRATLMAELEEHTGLVRANLAAQLIDAHPSDSLIQMLIGAYDGIDPGEIAETINAERAVAGFPAVGPHLVEDALQLDEMRSVVRRALWSDPSFLAEIFNAVAQESYLAIDPELHARQVEAGRQALLRGDIEGLRDILLELIGNRMTLGAGGEAATVLATIMRA